jgi:hypothetical protein
MKTLLSLVFDPLQCQINVLSGCVICTLDKEGKNLCNVMFFDYAVAKWYTTVTCSSNMCVICVPKTSSLIPKHTTFIRLII